MRGFSEFRKKYVWCGFPLNFMHKNCGIENFARFKQFTGMI